MNPVDIDVSKSKNMVAILRPFGEVVSPPFEIKHTISDNNSLVELINSVEGESRIVMKHTVCYYKVLAHQISEANLFVSAVNPKFIKDFDNDSLRKVKSDKADAVKIARYTLDKRQNLKQYNIIDELRNQPKTMNRQLGFYIKHKTTVKNNLISILDQTYPNVNTYFDSPARSDGNQKWMDFIHTYWHEDYVHHKSLSAFTDHYQRWCKRKSYNFSADKAERIYQASCDLIALFPKNDNTKMLIQQAVTMLNSASATVESLRQKMDETAARLPEYPVVMAMNGVGPTLGSQLMAEIGDVTRFTHRGTLTAFAGVDPGRNDSGQHVQKSMRTPKKGSPYLRKTLFQIMDSLIKRSPVDDAVYAFMDKKRTEGKDYYIYITAGANKFLRTYYGRVREYLSTLPENKEV